MGRSSVDELLLGEWACLGILYQGPTHGFSVARRLKPDGDVGRVWSLSRALTYRSLDQLARRALIEPIGEEPGIAGGNRTILAATRSGRAQFRRWLRTPVEHLRDLRGELLLKIVLADATGIDIGDTLAAQRLHVERFVELLTPPPGRGDVVELWRFEAATAALRFLVRLDPAPSPEL